MPPIVANPPNGGSTSGPTFNFSCQNAHDTHPAISILNWRVTIGTTSGGNDKYDSGAQNPPIGSLTITPLPADNNWYYTQVKYKKPNGSTGVGPSNYFQSRP